MPTPAPTLVKQLAKLRNLGEVSAAWIVRAGVESVDEFLASDPVELFERIEDCALEPVSLNMFKAIVGAQRDLDWRDVKVSRDKRDQITWSVAAGSERISEAVPLAKQLQALPNIGPTMAAHVIAGGVTSVEDFLARDPAELLIAIDRVYAGTNQVRMTLPHLKAICGAQQRVPWNDAVVDDTLREKFVRYRKG